MSSKSASAAAIRAWETYRMINPMATDQHRLALQQFIESRAASEDLSAEALAVEGLKYLKDKESDGSFMADNRSSSP